MIENEATLVMITFEDDNNTNNNYCNCYEDRKTSKNEGHDKRKHRHKFNSNYNNEKIYITVMKKKN